MNDGFAEMLRQSIGAERHGSRYSLSWFVGGALREMAQQIETNGVSRMVSAIAVVVIAAIIIGAGSAGIVATIANAKLEERIIYLEQRQTSSFCNINRRLDEIQHPQLQPRQCE